LLLFDTYDFLNSPKGGLESLNIYLTNLAGFYKLSWNYRLNKSNEVTLNFLDAYQGYTDIKSKNTNKIEKFLSTVSEPFQLISIGLATKNKNNKQQNT